jgi:CubicO group peptidase (beta-lactamase class C family)
MNSVDLTFSCSTYHQMMFSKAGLARLEQTIANHVESGLPGAVALVSRGGEAHVITAGQEYRRDTIFRIASMTKPVTAVAAMILVEEGRLRLDDPLDEYLPELANRRIRGKD